MKELSRNKLLQDIETLDSLTSNIRTLWKELSRNRLLEDIENLDHLVTNIRTLWDHGDYAGSVHWASKLVCIAEGIRQKCEKLRDLHSRG